MLEARLDVMLDVMLDASGFTTENMLLWLCRQKHAVKTTYCDRKCKHQHMRSFVTLAKHQLQLVISLMCKDEKVFTCLSWSVIF